MSAFLNLGPNFRLLIPVLKGNMCTNLVWRDGEFEMPINIYKILSRNFDSRLITKFFSILEREEVVKLEQNIINSLKDLADLLGFPEKNLMDLIERPQEITEEELGSLSDRNLIHAASCSMSEIVKSDRLITIFLKNTPENIIDTWARFLPMECSIPTQERHTMLVRFIIRVMDENQGLALKLLRLVSWKDTPPSVCQELFAKLDDHSPPEDTQKPLVEVVHERLERMINERKATLDTLTKTKEELAEEIKKINERIERADEILKKQGVK